MATEKRPARPRKAVTKTPKPVSKTSKRPSRPSKPATKATKAPAKATKPAARPRKRPARAAAPPAPIYGRNRTAAEETIAALEAARRLDDTDSARVASLRSLADAVDADGTNASLWREYRAAEASLREVRDDDTDGFAELIGKLSTSMGNAKES